jgi:hypothetical protein
MTNTEQALMWRGISPPPAGSRKTTCPVCSATRRKADEPCLSVYEVSWGVEWFCHHCGWEDGEAAQ